MIQVLGFRSFNFCIFYLEPYRYLALQFCGQFFLNLVKYFFGLTLELSPIQFSIPRVKYSLERGRAEGQPIPFIKYNSKFQARKTPNPII